MTQNQTPFFSRFLESQNPAKAKTDVKAGGWPPAQTQKWPSDDDDYPIPVGY